MYTETKNPEVLQQEIEKLKRRVAELEQNEQKHIEATETLKKSKNSLENIFWEARSGIGILQNRVFVEVNPIVSEITGYSRNELVGKNSRFLYPNDELYNFVGKEKYAQVKKYGTGTVNAVWRRKDGSLVDIRLTSTPIDSMDHTKGVIFTALDISNLKIWKNELQNSVERLKIIFENAPDAIYLNDFKGNFIDGNVAAENLTGYKRQELIGKNFLKLNLLPPKHLLKAAKLLAKNVMGLKTGPDKLELQTKNGEYKWIEVSTYPVTIENQKMILGIARDLTKRLEDEKFKRESQQRMAFHVNQTPLAVIEWDLNYKVRQWNQAAENIFGYSEEEAIGKHASFIIPKVELKNIGTFLHNLIRSKKGSKSVNKNVCKNGDIVLCEWHNTPLVDEKGEVIAIASLAHDITKRVHAQEIQRVAYNISNAANTSVSLNKLIKHIQKELSTIIDTTNFFIALYNKESDSFSLPFFIDEKDKFSSFPTGKTLTRYVIKNPKSLLATKPVIDKMEEKGLIESVGSDSEIWLGVPLQIEKEVIGALVLQSYSDPNAYNEEDLKMLEFVSNQISLTIHRKNTEEQMKKALQRATEADRLKSAFLANMSHEIRTPMNGILGFTNLLKNNALNTYDKEKYLSIIEKSGKRMLGLINDLIDISKIESGMSEVVTRDFSLNEMILDIHSFFKPEAEAKNLKLSCTTGLPNDSDIIKTDHEKIYAILINLVKNAIKYTNSGSISFGYELNNHSIHFTVKDTGIGIPKEKLNSIFNRFVQANSSLSRNFEGVGLGLAITKAYVELLKGKIWVDSTFAKGSVFTIEIPYVKGKFMNNTEEIEKTATEDKIKTKLKIILAEDDAINRKLFSYILKEISDDLLMATNGAEAVETFKNHKDVDLILMDLKMPQMDGYEATQIIRENDKDITIFALSAFALETEKERAAKNGFNAYITKPIGKAELLQKIGEHFKI